MEKSLLKKILPSVFIFIGMIAIGINSIIKGIDQHQTWRIVLASVGVAIFAAGLVLISIQLKKAKKVSV